MGNARTYRSGLTNREKSYERRNTDVISNAEKKILKACVCLMWDCWQRIAHRPEDDHWSRIFMKAKDIHQSVIDTDVPDTDVKEGLDEF
jgi:hypothetical protein